MTTTTIKPSRIPSPTEYHEETGLPRQTDPVNSALVPKHEPGADVFLAPDRTSGLVPAGTDLDASLWGKEGRFLHYTRPHGLAVVEVAGQPHLVNPSEVGLVEDRREVVVALKGDGDGTLVIDRTQQRAVRLLADGFGLNVDDNDEESAEMFWDWSHVRDSSPRAWKWMADAVREMRKA